MYGSPAPPAAGFEFGVSGRLDTPQSEESGEVSSEVINETIGGHKGVDTHVTGSREGASTVGEFEPMQAEIKAMAMQNELAARNAAGETGG